MITQGGQCTIVCLQAWYQQSTSCCCECVCMRVRVCAQDLSVILLCMFSLQFCIQYESICHVTLYITHGIIMTDTFLFLPSLCFTVFLFYLIFLRQSQVNLRIITALLRVTSHTQEHLVNSHVNTLYE